MNEKLNLVEILKDVPKGTKLWSPLCGECTLHGIDMSSDVPICVEVKVMKTMKIVYCVFWRRFYDTLEGLASTEVIDEVASARHARGAAADAHAVAARLVRHRR